MTYQNRLQEQYEDTLFALLMHEKSIIEGKQMEAELAQDQGFSVPEQCYQRSMKTIAKVCGKQSRQVAGRKILRTLRIAAVVALLSGLLLSLAMVVSAQLRANVLNTIIEVLDDRSIIHFIAGTPVEATPIITANWLPEGYTLQEEMADEGLAYQLYAAPDRLPFSVIVNQASINASYTIDSEDATMEYRNIQGYNATILRKNETVHIYWFMPEQAFFVDIVSEGIPDSDTIKYAENLLIE